jgi:hypothetical protein
MVVITEIDVFEKTAKDMLKASPKATRLTTKFRRADVPVFIMKVTDGRHSCKMIITKEQGVKAAQKIIATLMHMMTSTDLLQ